MFIWIVTDSSYWKSVDRVESPYRLLVSFYPYARIYCWTDRSMKNCWHKKNIFYSILYALNPLSTLFFIWLLRMICTSNTFQIDVFCKRKQCSSVCYLPHVCAVQSITFPDLELRYPFSSHSVWRSSLSLFSFVASFSIVVCYHTYISNITILLPQSAFRFLWTRP